MQFIITRTFRRVFILGVIVVGIISFSGCTGQIPTTETQTLTTETTKPVTTETITTKLLSKEDAAQIIRPIAETIWQQSEKTKGLQVNQYQQLLPKGTRVRPALGISPDDQQELVCQNECWLFFINEAPGAHFGHPVQIILLDAVTGEKQTIHAEWWPEIDEKPVFDTVTARTDKKSIIFYEAPQLSIKTSQPIEIR